MPLDVLGLTKELVAIDSVSARSNAAAADRLEAEFRERGFEVERLEYDDAAGVRKVNLVARKGEGTGGLAFLSHLDTVPGTGWDRDPWSPIVEGDRLIGLGACDMKGPLAATLIAAEVFGAAFAGGWAVALLLNLADWGHYVLQALFFAAGVVVMAAFIRSARRIEPFTEER